MNPASGEEVKDTYMCIGDNNRISIEFLSGDRIRFQCGFRVYYSSTARSDNRPVLRKYNDRD